MIGILCNQKKENILAKQFHTLLDSLDLPKRAQIMVFTIPNVNFSNMTVQGTFVSGDKITQAEAKLPAAIFNFSVQYKKANIKKLRALIEAKDVLVINPTNQFNQFPIMDMLSANKKIRKLIFSYSKYSGDDTLFAFTKDKNLLIKPQSKPSLSRIAYVKHWLTGFDIMSNMDKFYCHTKDFLNKVRPIIHCRNWIALETPELATYGNQLIVIRVYMQKCFDEEWTVITKDMYPQDKELRNKLTQNLDSIALQIVSHINCFITNLGISYIDFVFDTHGSPYFLNFGGYDDALLDEKRDKRAQENFLKNMLEYARVFINKPKGGINYVG